MALRNLAVLGDATSNGGKIITASDDIKWNEKGIALLSDKASCPVCNIEAQIVPLYHDTFQGAKYKEQPVALNGDLVDCNCVDKPYIIASSKAAHDDMRTK